MKHRILFATMMSFVLSILMTAWVTFVNLGLHPEFLSFWMKSWVLAWPAAGAISFVFAPMLHKLAQRLADKL
ncbi:DUF2798 domain-containing protein [Maribrevibacterium harenarium]|jgi:hypothetical protein|uniref:DUF2798 domain-containing protein n=1 Tax=Maribrevibacterium harenarium TaxID=2589817 RepID=A0A501X4F2_9GAMM|nr:DUF2798 domain-containing protein [Maribrevibacterium harenarium]TPE55297.1 DUF2798 domain-containing protein [Maribrevibacterium harenarium]